MGPMTPKETRRQWAEVERLLDTGQPIPAALAARRLIKTLTFSVAKGFGKVGERVLSRLTPLLHKAATDPFDDDVKFEAKLRRALGEPPSEITIAAAISDWFSTPINNHGTPYVPHPLDFTPAEQGAFVALVHEPRRVSRDEQIAKIREIVAARPVPTT